MQLTFEANPAVTRTLTPSVFNTILPTADPATFVVYNTLYRTVAEVPRAALPMLGWSEDKIDLALAGPHPRALKSLSGDGPGQPLAPDAPVLAQGTAVERMVDLQFLVDGSVDEHANLHDYLSVGYTPKVFYPVIAFTAACNLACVYCFEEGSVDRSKTMAESTGLATVTWIRRYAEQHELDAISLGLFGGEPLLNLSAANFFIDGVATVARDLGLRFEFGVTTNGTRLTRELILDWTKRGLQEVRITLDGPRDVHDERRFYRGRGRRGSFDDIIERLRSIVDVPGFNITVEVNLDAQNYSRVGDLLTCLEAAGLRDRVLVCPEQTLETLASSRAGGAECGGPTCGRSCAGQEEPDPAWFASHVLGRGANPLVEAFVSAVDQIASRGFRMPEMVGVYYPCIFVQRHHVVIDWHGEMYKCSFTIGNEQMVVGDVSSGFNWRNGDMLGSVEVIDWCKRRQCAYIPICGGGCRYESYNRTGSYHVPNCKADLIDTVLPRTLPYAFGVRPLSTAPE